jgi:hypothetical protein
MGYRRRANIDEESRDGFADRPIRNADPLHKIAQYCLYCWVTDFDEPVHRIDIVLVAREKLTKVTTVLPCWIVVGTILIAHASCVGPLKSRSDCRGRVRRRDDRNHLEVGHIVPVRHPLIEKSPILALHDLETAAQVGRDPTAAILDALWHEAATVTEPPIHRKRITAAKCFNHHVQHGHQTRGNRRFVFAM